MLYRETECRQEHLKRLGYTLVVMWECKFDQLCKADLNYHRFVSQFWEHFEPIKPRDALYGGRTNSVNIYYKTKEDEEIKYLDVLSLYPFVNKYREYPLGHPDILSSDEIDINNIISYRGLLKCKILPPQTLWLPLLPIHCNKKMMFPLCLKCCTNNDVTLCNHSIDERCLIGTWTMVEICEAIKLGYKIIEVYQLWSWKTWSNLVYNKYIDAFLKIKQEASGYPLWVKTKEDEIKFKEDYFRHEGILLGVVEHNIGLRSFAKTMLNCLWGKNAQCNLMTETEYIAYVQHFFDLMQNPDISIHCLELFDSKFFYYGRLCS